MSEKSRSKPPKFQKTAQQHPGPEALRFCLSQMQVEERWAVFGESAVHWWNDGFRQTLWTSEPWIDEDCGLPTCRVYAKTDVAVGEVPEEISAPFGVNMLGSSMSGLVRDETSGVLALECSARVCSGDMVPVAWFATAAIIQQWTAAGLAANLQAKFGLSPSTSAHPTEGARAEPGSVPARFLCELVSVSGAAPNRWDRQDDVDEVFAALQRQGLQVGRGEDGVRGRLFVQLPFGGQGTVGEGEAVPTLLRIFVRDPHPELGDGIAFLMFLPPNARKLRPDLTPLRLNVLESRLLNGPHRFGSWCLFPGGPGGNELAPAYVAFLPSILHGPGATREMTFGMVLRALWANNVFHTPPSE